MKSHISLLFGFSFALILLQACPTAHSIEESATSKIDGTNHRRKEVVIFVYHRFGNNKYPSTNISAELFEEHLKYLHEKGFKLMTFGESVQYINDASIPYVEKSACITIDDGFKSFFTNGLPLLKRYQTKATLFINTESVGGGSYMDWDELKKVAEDGIEIGNHSHSHAYFVSLPSNEQLEVFERDVHLSQQLIFDKLGFYPEVFAYPYGEFSLGMKQVIKELNFSGAAAQNSGVYTAGDNFAVPRFPMAGPYTRMDGFKEKAHMHSLRITKKSVQSNILGENNRPSLELTLDTTLVDPSSINCFTSSPCSINTNGNLITIQASKPLTKRRTLYTITAPSKNGKGWNWYSHLWIRPEVEE